MAHYGFGIKTTRSESPHGKVIIIHSPQMARIAQVYQGVSERGLVSFHCWVMTCLAPEREPTVSRFPLYGGYDTIDALEEELCNPYGGD